MKRYDVVIIGGGAAGLFCAIEAGKRGRRTLVIEHNGEVGRKIVISGGGRCNFTNRSVRAENFISSNPHFAKSALARYTPDDFVELVKKHGIAFYEKKLGQLFCRESSRQIVAMLLDECRAAKVEIKTGCRVESVAKSDGFLTKTSCGDFKSDSLVVATGGLSFAKVGATGFGYDIARQFGLAIVGTRPSLVPLTFTKEKGLTKLAGVSVDSAVTTDRHTFRENILFTHRGLSGPAILQISNYWDAAKPVRIDLMPETDAEELFADNRASKQLLSNFLSRSLPSRFAQELAAMGLPDKQVSQLSDKEIARICRTLKGWEVSFGGTEGYDKAEVTIGGVDTDELSSQTMESKKVPGLYFIGEVVDVTGWLGGYNFQWAWSSGYVCGGNA